MNFFLRKQDKENVVKKFLLPLSYESYWGFSFCLNDSQAKGLQAQKPFFYLQQKYAIWIVATLHLLHILHHLLP